MVIPSDNWILILIVAAITFIGGAGGTAVINYYVKRRASNIDLLKILTELNNQLTLQLTQLRTEFVTSQAYVVRLMSDSTAMRSTQLQLDILTSIIQRQGILYEELKAKLVSAGVDGGIADAVAELVRINAGAIGSIDDTKRSMGELAIKIAAALQRKEIKQQPTTVTEGDAVS